LISVLSAYVSNCICFCCTIGDLPFYYLILANYFTFGGLLFAIPPVFYLGFKYGFYVFVFCSNSLLPALVFCFLILRPVYFYFHRFFGCLQIVSAYNFCFGIYALHVRILQLLIAF